MIPVYIVTGFIGSGKSTFINEQLQYRKKLGGTAIISAEEGSEPLIKEPLQLNADELNAIVPSDIKSYELIACKIGDYLKRLQPKSYGLSGMAW